MKLLLKPIHPGWWLSSISNTGGGESLWREGDLLSQNGARALFGLPCPPRTGRIAILYNATTLI